MPWIYLFIAGLLEIGWPLGLKISQTPGRFWPGVTLALVCMAGSGALLWLAQKSIAIGTAYAVWTGIGTVGTFLVGIALFGDSSHTLRLLSALLVVIGIVGLKLAP